MYLKPVEIADDKFGLVRFREKLAAIGLRYESLGSPMLLVLRHEFTPDNATIQQALAEREADGGVVIAIQGALSDDGQRQVSVTLQPYRLATTTPDGRA